MASAKTLRTIVAGFIVFLFFYLAVIPTGSSKKKKVIEEHPTQEEKDGKAKTKVCPEEMYTMDDVKKHTKCSLRDTKNNDLWLVIDDKVYDVTPWIIRHPGGDRICDGAGRDASQLFANNHHSGIAREEELPNYCIGHLKKDFAY